MASNEPFGALDERADDVTRSPHPESNRDLLSTKQALFHVSLGGDGLRREGSNLHMSRLTGECFTI